VVEIEVPHPIGWRQQCLAHLREDPDVQISIRSRSSTEMQGGGGRQAERRSSEKLPHLQQYEDPTSGVLIRRHSACRRPFVRKEKQSPE